MRSSIEGIFLESCNDGCRVRGYSRAWIYSSCCWRNRAGKLFNKTCSGSSQLSMQCLSNKQTGSMLFPFFLLASNTDKPLGDDTFQNQSVRLICWQAFSFIRFLNCFFLLLSWNWCFLMINSRRETSSRFTNDICLVTQMAWSWFQPIGRRY